MGQVDRPVPKSNLRPYAYRLAGLNMGVDTTTVTMDIGQVQGRRLCDRCDHRF